MTSCYRLWIATYCGTRRTTSPETRFVYMKNEMGDRMCRGSKIFETSKKRTPLVSCSLQRFCSCRVFFLYISQPLFSLSSPPRWPCSCCPLCPTFFVLTLLQKMDCKDSLTRWASKGKLMFPHLAPVAQQVFGNQAAAAAQIERDSSGCGNLLVPNRSRIETYWVDMVMFLEGNVQHIPAYGERSP